MYLVTKMYPSRLTGRDDWQEHKNSVQHYIQFLALPDLVYIIQPTSIGCITKEYCLIVSRISRANTLLYKIPAPVYTVVLFVMTHSSGMWVYNDYDLRATDAPSVFFYTNVLNDHLSSLTNVGCFCIFYEWFEWPKWRLDTSIRTAS